jgi:hypothetical protein
VRPAATREMRITEVRGDPPGRQRPRDDENETNEDRHDFENMDASCPEGAAACRIGQVHPFADKVLGACRTGLRAICYLRLGQVRQADGSLCRTVSSVSHGKSSHKLVRSCLDAGHLPVDCTRDGVDQSFSLLAASASAAVTMCSTGWLPATSRSAALIHAGYLENLRRLEEHSSHIRATSVCSWPRTSGSTTSIC